ncbi:GNAT family N-acetyltransferase [Luteolibacter flavescens]|uniref:GNAT family N-acetyltransferase n=1 Tax=Luteolibacter flavescens TaxID=1859460 RepID=A0ABT3FMK5_9BACT|nr:GNAT family N-acetyltransferase [Luteolibacter flavescens]
MRWSTRTTAESRAIRRFAQDVRYRIYRQEDEAACVGIYRALESGFPSGGEPEFLERLRQSDRCIVVAERQGSVIGMGGISMESENVAMLWYGLVLPEHQGKGIGTTLALLRLCSLPSDEFNVFIYTLAKPRTFYRRLGFSICSEWGDEHGQQHPIANLHLGGFRRDFVLDILRSRGVIFKGPLIPCMKDSSAIGPIAGEDGSTRAPVVTPGEESTA